MPPHESRLPDKESKDPTTPPSTPVSDSEMALGFGQTPHLAPDAKNLLAYLKDSPDFEVNPISFTVHYYLPGETDSSDSLPSPRTPPRSSEQRNARSLRSSNPTRSATSHQGRDARSFRGPQRSGFWPPPRDDRVAKERTEEKALCKACRIHCPPASENDINDNTLRTTGLRGYLRSLLGRPTTTTQDSPSGGAQNSTGQTDSGPSRPTSSRQTRLRHRRRQDVDQREVSLWDPEYDSESGTTSSAISPPPQRLPVPYPPRSTARSSLAITPSQRRATSRVASPNLTSRSSLALHRFSPLVPPRTERRRSQPGSRQGSPSVPPIPISPRPQPISPLQASAVHKRVTHGVPAPSLASSSFTSTIHPPLSSVPGAMATQLEPHPLPRGAPVPIPAPAIRPLLRRRSAVLAPLQVPTSSRTSPDLFSPNRERDRSPRRREEPFATVMPAMAASAPPGSPATVRAEENQTMSGGAEATGDLEGSSSATNNGRVAVTVDNLSAKSRRRRRGLASSDVQVLRSARIRDLQAKREADTAARGPV